MFQRLLLLLGLLAFPVLIQACNGSGDDDDDDDDNTSDCTDNDQDGYCNLETAPEGGVYDCDDDNASVNPGMAEICDGQDNDCDGTKDDGLTQDILVWPDKDFDTYGNFFANNYPIYECGVFKGFANNGWDCDDTDAMVHPEACEIDDNKDNDCDDEIDESDGQCKLADVMY